MALLPLPVGSTASVSRPAPIAASARRWDGRRVKPKTDPAIRSTAAASVIASILPQRPWPIVPTGSQPRMAGMDLETAYGKLALLDPEMGRLVDRFGRPDPFSFSPILSRVGEDRFRALMLSI